MPSLSDKKVIADNDAGNHVEIERIKHPLEHRWSFWMLTNNKCTWEDNLVKITSFDTVEDYWCLYHHTKRPSELSLGQDYAIFKNDIRPMWEDRANKSGGRWLVLCDRKINHGKDILDASWLHVVLLLIGESFKRSDAICGAVVNVRVKNKIGIWLSNAKDEEAVLAVGKQLIQELSYQGRINFHVHNTSDNKYII